MSNRDWYRVPPQEAVEAIGSHLEKGLTSEEAATRLREHGPNELVGRKPPGFWQLILKQLNNYLIWILLVAMVVSAALGEWVDAVVITLIVVINAVLGVIQESKAEKALEALQKMAAPLAKVIRDGVYSEVPGRELVPGDIVSLEAGNYVPADLRLIESVNLRIEEAALTGESLPVEKRAETVFSDEVALGNRENTAYMSTVVTYGRGTGVVVSTGMNTEIGLIAEMLRSYDEGETPLQKKLAGLGKFLGTAVLIICAVVFVAGLLRGEEILSMFLTAVSLAVAAIPEGLPAIVTIVLALGMQRMVSRHAIMKRLHAVETLGSTTVICSDKTGTLTQNKMMVTRLYTPGRQMEVTGEGYNPYGSFVINREKINPGNYPDVLTLLQCGVLCNDAKLEQSGEGPGKGEQWRIIGDPTEGALIAAGAKAGLSRPEINAQYRRMAEIPFDSERKRMTTLHARPDNPGYYAFVKGAPDIMLSLCDKVLENSRVRPMTENDRADILAANGAMANKALRVLGFAYREYGELPGDIAAESIEKELTFIGLMGMIDPARPEAVGAVKKCRQAGIRPVMITGDYRETAVAIARELGLLRSDQGVRDGAQLERMTEAELREAVLAADVYARVSPEHKVRIVEALRSHGHIAAMTGDGVNDAPALKRADIGIAMGITGTDVAKETADMVLTDDNFASIVSAVEEGRIIYANIRKFIYYLLSCNIGEVLIIFLSIIAGLPIPLVPVQLLWTNLLTDAFPALALGMEKGEADVMDKPPRNPEAPIIDRKAGLDIALQSGVIAAATLGAYLYGLRLYGQAGAGLATARTMAFFTLTTAELLRAYANRSERYTALQLGIFSNRYLNAGVGVSFLLIAASYIFSPLRQALRLAVLDFEILEVIIAFGILPYLATEVRKLFRRRR